MACHFASYHKKLLFDMQISGDLTLSWWPKCWLDGFPINQSKGNMTLLIKAPATYVAYLHELCSTKAKLLHFNLQIFQGNENSETVKIFVLHLDSIFARYIRINPRTWNNSICLRTEIYGCPYNPEKGKKPTVWLTWSLGNVKKQKHASSTRRVDNF